MLDRNFLYSLVHVHSLVSGNAGIANNEDNQSGMPMRVYHQLMKQYNVAGVFSGHDELLEYVELGGVRYWDAGFAGDGLLGPGYAPTTLYVSFDLLPTQSTFLYFAGLRSSVFGFKAKLII